MTRRLHFFRNLRTALALLAVAALAAGVGFVWWANHVGLPDTWRALIEREIEKKGFYVSVESLSYSPLRGVTAKEIRVFSDESRTRVVSRLERVLLDFDNTKLARGDVKLKKIELQDGQLELPMDPDDPASPVLEATGINATIEMPGGRLLEIREARGQIEGIDIDLSAHLLGYRPVLGHPKADDPNRKARMELIRRCLDEASHWTFGDTERPKVSVTIDGDLVDRTTLQAQLKLSARKVIKDERALESVAAEAELSGSLLTINSFNAKDSSGKLAGHGDYDLQAREGRFNATSSLELPGLLKAWFGVPQMKNLSLEGEQRLEVAGTFQLPEGKPAVVALTGDAACRAVKLKGVPFDSISTAFSWREGGLYLRDIEISHREGKARGKAMWQNRVLKLSLESSLPLANCRPFFKGSTFGNVLEDFKETDRTTVDVTIGGSIDFAHTDDWHLTGRARMTHAAYRGAPFNWAQTDLDLSHKALDFLNGTAEFDYRNYEISRAFKGVKTGNTKVKLVRYDSMAKAVVIEGVEGNFWPAPVLRMFAPKVADNLETYRFHSPPSLQVSGLIDVTPSGRTDIKATFRSEDPAEYVFLDHPLTLLSPSGNVRVDRDRVTVDNLKFRVCGGPVDAKVVYLAGKSPTIGGEFRWTKLSLNELGGAYGFDTKGGGDLTGRVEFTMESGRVGTMSGNGLIGLENGELFSVPVFGPLSPLLAGILADRRAGFQQAREAFCTFKIRDGELSTNDFRTGTQSLAFTGDAKVDLARKTLDMTMRMNARGLLGLITLPLRPFYGLFQFRGRGDLKHPVWENAMFTSPPEEQKEALFNPPKARVIPEP